MNIAIAGYGVEGKANYTYWRSKGEVTIVDERDSLDDAPTDASTILGPDAFKKLADFDLVVRTAGVAPRKIVTNGKIWSATNEFFEVCPAPIIGVTGTKGKGTTASLIASILEAGGKTVQLVGNIGTPALDALPKIEPEHVVVYELSSFQLWDIERSPHVAVVLGIEPDHQDVHTDMEDYVSAKANITRYQSTADVVVYDARNEYARQIAELSPARDKRAVPVELDVLDAVVLPGQHNRENASAAVTAVQDFVRDENVIRTGLSSFRGLPHRLKYVATVHGIRYYDDSIGTTPGSSIAAIRSFPDQQKVVILGGSDKGASYGDIIEVCRQTETRIVAIGQTGADIYELAQRCGVVSVRETGSMLDVVRVADKIAREGDVVILSPASASFDQYKNYADRGDQFIAAVNSLA